MSGETDQQKSEQAAFSNMVVGALFAFLGAILLGALGLLAAPIIPYLPVWATGIVAVSTIAGLIFFTILLVRLGGSSAQSEHREWYESFRFGILTDNYNGRYSLGIAKAIKAIDRFFGDAGKLGEMEEAEPKPLGLFPKAFGLKMPAPLWTAASYDRCLLLALAYPLVALLVFWTIWGGTSIGEAEAALGMELEPEGWRRTLGLGAIIVVWLAYWGFANAKSWWAKLIWLAAAAAALGVAVAVAVAGAVAVAAVFIIDYSIKKRLFGPALLVFSLLMLAEALWAPAFVSIQRGIALLYFLGLLTLVNAPFDWAALGITRGLLRRGQQSGGIVPLIAALLDLFLSLVLMAMLAFAILWATEIFNFSSISGGNDAVINVPEYLAAMNDPAQRGDPKYYWLYAMLFSSQIPAIANFAFSALCLLRGVPLINRKIAQMMPESGDIGSWQRLGVASLASVQLALAVAIGLGLYYAMAAGFIAVLDPLFAGGLVSVLEHAQISPLLG